MLNIGSGCSRDGSFSGCNETRPLHTRFYGGNLGISGVGSLVDVLGLVGYILDVQHRVCALPRFAIRGGLVSGPILDVTQLTGCTLDDPNRICVLPRWVVWWM